MQGDSASVVHDSSLSSMSHDGEESRLSLWTSHMYRLYAILALGYLCIVFQGYDGSLMSSINAMVSLNALTS